MRHLKYTTQRKAQFTDLIIAGIRKLVPPASALYWFNIDIQFWVYKTNLSSSLMSLWFSLLLRSGSLKVLFAWAVEQPSYFFCSSFRFRANGFILIVLYKSRLRFFSGIAFSVFLAVIGLLVLFNGLVVCFGEITIRFLGSFGDENIAQEGDIVRILDHPGVHRSQQFHSVGNRHVYWSLQ